ncbi:outer membrane homotrimeric porin [Mailhella sp.]|uniref:outer membrane homotrimeric porin n=1 Tax=Mailhella sp. TaxID=1981029 RepID=UPI004063BC81
MKKIITLLAAAGMVVAASAPANAVDVKVDGRYRFSMSTGQDFTGANSEDFRHRMRLGLTMAASENLSARVLFQVNHGNQIGNTTKHGKTANDNDDITAREMYLDWTVPGTAIKVRMGRHCLGLPADAFGSNAVLSAGYGAREGIVLTSPVSDWLGLTAIWTRLGTDTKTNLDQNKTDDMYALAANLKFDGISGSVYTAFATMDGGVETNNGWNGGFKTTEGDAWWVGGTATISMFDPFVLKLSAAYGEFNAANAGEKNSSGYNIQAKASYKTAFGTPVLGAWYISGNDENDRGYMPNAGYWSGTRHFYDGFASLTNGYATNNFGTWAVQAGIENVSFLEGLTHELLVTYMQGTNEKGADGKFDYADKNGKYNAYLTEDDSLVEISLNNVYKIYKNLAARLELAYIINDFDDDAKLTDDKRLSEDDWYASITFDYQF